MRLVWYVDDNETQRQSIAAELEAKIPGTAVRTWACGQSVIDALRNDDIPPFCIISDERMDGISGFGLWKMLGEMGYEIPFILISADEEAIHRYVSSGIIALPKPDGHKFKSENFISRLGAQMDTIEIRKEIHDQLEPMKKDLAEVLTYIRETRNVDVLTKISNFVDDCQKNPLLKWVIVPVFLALFGIIYTVIKFKGIK